MKKNIETFFYTRKETGKEIMIVFNNYPILMISYISPLILAWIVYLSDLNSTIGIIVFTFIYYIIMMLFFRNKLKEIKKAMKKGNVKVSGSKWSFKNPLKYIIKKNNMETKSKM